MNVVWGKAHRIKDWQAFDRLVVEAGKYPAIAGAVAKNLKASWDCHVQDRCAWMLEQCLYQFSS